VTALAPAGAAGADIPVQLTVAANMTRTYLPVTGSGFSNTWYDPDTTGGLYRLDLNLGNDGLAQVVLPFSVSFYGASFLAAQISENGLIAFGAGNTPMRPPAACPGNGAAPNNTLYAFGADWVADGGASVVVHYPNADTFVVTWRDVRLNGTQGRATFQAVITRAGEFRVNFRSLTDPRAGMIGAENDDGTLAQRILCQGAGQPAPAGGSVLLSPRAPW
jgi:hypothetical protein